MGISLETFAKPLIRNFKKKRTNVALVRLVSSPYYSPAVPVDLIERLYLYRGVKLEMEIDLSLNPGYYCLEYEEANLRRRAYFPYWYDVELAVDELISGRAGDSELLPFFREGNELGDAVNV